MHEARTMRKIESFKKQAPGSLPSLKADYAPKYAEMMEDLAVEPQGNIAKDDLQSFEGHIGVGKMTRDGRPADY